MTAVVSRKRDHYPPMIVQRVPRVLARIRASASRYIRTKRLGAVDRAALRILIEEGVVEIFESPVGRAYREKQ
jgi:hypothetical protein